MVHKDWTGNSRSVHAMLGARNYSQNERETNDYYATEPKAARLLMDVEYFSPIIWECACGEGHLVREFEKAGYMVYASDLIDRGVGVQLDFLHTATPPISGADIITNPPYSLAKEFVEHALDISEDGCKENPTPVTPSAAYDSLCEEIGDVRLCISVVEEMYGEFDTKVIEDKKLLRWRDRLRLSHGGGNDNAASGGQ